MLRAGAVFVSLWSGLNLLLALGIVVAILAFGQDPPGLHLLLSPSDIAALDPKVIGTFRALGVLANGCIAAFCFLVLAVTWLAVVRRGSWGPRVLFPAVVFVQAMGFASDLYLQQHDLVANLVSSAVLVAGLVLLTLGLRTSPGPG